MKSGLAVLGGIGYRVDVHERMATFVERDRMSCARITVQKSDPHDLIYVQSSSATGFVPFAHIKKAVEISEGMFGPNHYKSLSDKHRCERNIAAKRVVSRPYLKMSQRLFWTYEIPSRFRALWWLVFHQYRLLIPEHMPQIKESVTA